MARLLACFCFVLIATSAFTQAFAQSTFEAADVHVSAKRRKRSFLPCNFGIRPIVPWLSCEAPMPGIKDELFDLKFFCRNTAESLYGTIGVLREEKLARVTTRHEISSSL